MTLFPGVRMNFNKNSVSISGGAPGFRKTVSSTGRVTTSVGIPGTGIYYVDTKNVNAKAPKLNTQSRSRQTINNYASPQSPALELNNTPLDYTTPDFSAATYEVVESRELSVTQISAESLTSIHKTCDDTIDWTEILVCDEPPDGAYSGEMWRFYHSLADEVLNGNIDTYLQLIFEVNPLDDLLAYGGQFQFGTDDPRKIEVEYVVNEATLQHIQSTLSRVAYNEVLQDFICGTAIRIARDMFALLPLQRTIVHAVLAGDTVLSVDFPRATMERIKFGFIDPSDVMSKFEHRMCFTAERGFEIVGRIE